MVASTSGDAHGLEQRELALTASVESSENKGSRAHILQYEQLLSIQQDQHALAMERKDAEVAHLKVRLAALEARSSVCTESCTVHLVRATLPHKMPWPPPSRPRTRSVH
ncbi:unnamed protein product [Symbiodinium sp. CCMP2592]|nr:unnamed protein product [Symbiodinium sp. CCMP2592]